MDGSPKEQLKQFLEPYTKEELENLIVSYCEEHTDATDLFLKKIKSDKKWCKLFVHGLAFTTSKETLEKHYEKYGKIKEAVVLVDKKGNSRGYGFVTFESADEALNASRALSEADVEKKKIDNRITHCNLAWKGNPKKGWTTGSPNQPLSVQARQEANDRRLFVHSLAWKTDDESLRNAFREFGELVEAVVIRDKKTGKSKGYGFVTFKHPESARAALSNPSKMIDSRKTRCNYASSRDTKLYSDTDTNAATSPEPVDLNGSDSNVNGNGSDDISFNPNGGNNIMNIPPRGLTPNSTQQPFLHINGLFPDDIHFQINNLSKSQNPNAEMYLRSAARPTLNSFNSNSTFSNFNPSLFNMNSNQHNNNPNNQNNQNNMNNVPINNGNNILLSNPLSGAFVMSNNNNNNNQNNNNNNTNNNINNANNNINKMMNNLNGLISSPPHQNNMNNMNNNNMNNNNNQNMNMMNMNMMNMNMMTNMNKPGIIVHAANNIQVPNTPPMYAHLSSPIKAPSVSSVHSFLTPAAPVPMFQGGYLSPQSNNFNINPNFNPSIIIPPPTFQLNNNNLNSLNPLTNTTTLTNTNTNTNTSNINNNTNTNHLSSTNLLNSNLFNPISSSSANNNNIASSMSNPSKNISSSTNPSLVIESSNNNNNNTKDVDEQSIKSQE